MKKVTNEVWLKLATLIRSAYRGTRPDREIKSDEWAEKNRILPVDTPEPGPFRLERTPYLIDIHRTMSPMSPWKEGWWMKPHQVGGSVTGENLIGSWICNAAGQILVVFPTKDDALQWELTRFEPMRVNTQELRSRIPDATVKGSSNTKLRKKFPGGTMRLVGANKVSALKSMSIRYVKFEEPDEFSMDLRGQGSPIDLAKKRTSNFGWRAKIYGDSTPTIAGYSAIEDQVKRGDQRKWHLNCPHCGFAQPLIWKNLHWDKDNIKDVKYVCSECGAAASEAEWKIKNYSRRSEGMSEEDAARAGLAFWRATAEGEPGVASWLGFNALGAPLGWRPWPELVAEWLEAQGNTEKLRIFINNNLGETYEDRIRAAVTASDLITRKESYKFMTAPKRCLCCTAGIDVQDNRLALNIWGWGRGSEHWLIWHSEVWGDPGQPEVWIKAKEIIHSDIRHENGNIMKVEATAIDSGGHHTEDVYAFCKAEQMEGQHTFPIKGSSQYDAPMLGKPKPIEFNWKGKPCGRVRLTVIGTQSIKNVLDNQLSIKVQGPGYTHFASDTSEEFFKQFRAERQEYRNHNGRKVKVWVASGRNEAWDCTVYSMAALLYLRLGMPEEKFWRIREKVYGEQEQPDLFTQNEPVKTIEVNEKPAAMPLDNKESVPSWVKRFRV